MASWTKQLSLGSGTHVVNGAGHRQGRQRHRAVGDDQRRPRATTDTARAPGHHHLAQHGHRGAGPVLRGERRRHRDRRRPGRGPLGAARVDSDPILSSAQSTSAAGFGQWAGKVVLPDPGQHVVTVDRHDAAGNASEASIMLNVTLAPDVVNRLNRIILVESFRLSSFLGSYGRADAKTFSLLPGEKTKISIKSYTKTETDARTPPTSWTRSPRRARRTSRTRWRAEQCEQENYQETWNYKCRSRGRRRAGAGAARRSAPR